MPTTVSLPKLAATRGYGARVRLEGESFDEALAHATRLASEQGLTFIHAYDDPHIIAGQGTVGLELLAQLPDVDAIVVPVGGGGLLAGVATAVKTLRPSVKVFGVQAAAAPAVARSKAAGAKIVVPAATTVADGIAVATPGEAGLESIVRHVEDIALVDEEAITQAMVLLLERCKLVVEGAGAVTVAALLSERLKVPNGQVALLLSGGNVDANVLAQVIEHGLVHASRFLALRVTLLDRPGQLAALLECLAEAKSNVVEVSHHRRGPHLRLGQVAVEVSLEVRDPDHAREVIEHLERRGYTRQSLSAEFSVPGVHYFTVVQ
jgi:threonine dehydratase